MVRHYKLKSDNSRARIDFSLSSLQASQVPKGWDNLFVSVVSVETGKIIAKTGKTTVKSGKCRWSETLSESLCIILGETRQDADQCLIKLVIATGSVKSGILGEIRVNLIDHINGNDSFTLSLPLKKCIYGTLLHVKVQCISPQTSQSFVFKIENSSDKFSTAGDLNTGCDDMENKSDISDSCFTKSFGSSSSNCFESSSHTEDVESRDTIIKMSGSHNSLESLDDSVGRKNSTLSSNFNGNTEDTLGRLDSTGYPRFNHSSSKRVPRSRGQSLGQADDLRLLSTVDSSSLLNNSLSKEFFEEGDGSDGDFRVQAKMWERNARRLTMELERLRKMFDEQSKNVEILDWDLASSKAQCDGLKQDNEKLKNLLEETRHKSLDSLNSHSINFHQHLEDELRFYKESNAKLGVQLEKTQESNAELVSILQEMEETIEKQKREISSQLDEIAVYKNMSQKKAVEQDLPEDRRSTEATENDVFVQNLHASFNHIEKPNLQLQQLHKEHEKLLSTILDLERTLEERTRELETKKSLKTQTLLDSERIWRSKLVAKDEEIINLDEKLSEAMLTRPSNSKKLESADKCYLVEEIQALRDKVQELEKDCNELTEENLDLLVKLKRAENCLQKSSASFNSSSTMDESEKHSHDHIDKDIETGKTQLLVKHDRSLSEDKCKGLEDNSSRHINKQKDGKRLLEDCNDTQIIEETGLVSDSMDILDCRSLNESVGTHDSDSEVLHQLSSELESGKLDLELQISDLEKENVQLSERISGLEAQLRYLTDEKESSRLELQQSGSRVILLQEEIRKLQIEMNTQRNDMNQKLVDIQQRWSEAQEECEYLKILNAKLQDTTEKTIEECSLLQGKNRDLKIQNLELHDHCALLKAGLRESENTYSLTINKIETLEADFSSLAEEISFKAESFNSEINALLLENEKLKGQLLTEESQFFQDYLEKHAEVENLLREVQYLSEQLLKVQNGEHTSIEAALEISSLLANNAKLQAAQLEGQGMLQRFKQKYGTLKVEFEASEAEFSQMLANSNQKYEVLLADRERMQTLLGEAKSREQKTRSIIYKLELKLKASEYERSQLEDETASLKHQLLKLLELQNENLALKSSLNEAKFANGRLEASFQLLYQDHEDLKAEKVKFIQKLISMQMLESELEDCKNSKIALQEKLLRLEGDLTAREAECAEDVKLKHELGRMRRTNSQLQRKIKDFEYNGDEGTPKQKILRHVASDMGSRFGKPRSRHSISTSNTTILEESDLSKMNNGNHLSSRKSLLMELDSESPEMSQLPKPQRRPTLTYKESKEEEYKKKTSELETELKDLHNRYFNMSLKYAEIETEREELSMKLNAVEQGRRWFSYKP